MLIEKYDVAIIGSGPAGYAAAILAADLNKKVCLIEKQAIGGAGIINGALTSKTLWQLSQDYSIAARTDRGYRASALNLEFSQVIKSVRDAAKQKIFQLKSQLVTYTNGTIGQGSIKLLQGIASFIDAHTLEVCTVRGCEKVSADYILIATGSRPRLYEGLDIDHKHIITSDDILRLEKFPEKMIIVGSGIIGTEYATIFSNFAQTQVHLLDRQNRVIPFEDDDVSDFISKNLEQNSVIIHHQAKLKSIEKIDDSLEVILDFKDGRSQVFEADLALISIGRVPNIEDLKIENIGLQANENNYLITNDNLQIINNKGYNHIYAAGDVNGSTQLYSVAEAQGRYAIKRMFQITDEKLDYFNMPTLMFFKPELAAVGHNEKKLQQNKIPYKAVFYSNSLINRAISMKETNGFIKILASNDGKERILGMRAAGPQASAMIVAIAHLLNKPFGIKQVLDTVYPHPSIPEGIQDCLRVLKNQSIYKPYIFPIDIYVKTWSPE